jgi:hypothetical protein
MFYYLPTKALHRLTQSFILGKPDIYTNLSEVYGQLFFTSTPFPILYQTIGTRWDTIQMKMNTFQKYEKKIKQKKTQKYKAIQAFYNQKQHNLII